jgi:hypothetical protein
VNQFVSERWTYVAALVAAMSAVCVLFIPGFPVTGLLWVGLAFSVALWMNRRRPARSTAQVIWDVEGEAARVPAQPKPRATR